MLHNQKVDLQGKKKKKKESGLDINQVSYLYGCTEVIFAAVIFVKTPPSHSLTDGVMLTVSVKQEGFLSLLS